MEEKRLFSLEKRVENSQVFLDDINNTRLYDIDIRISMGIPIEKISRIIAAQIERDNKVLDVGCNTGLVTLMTAMAAPACDIIGIEENENLLTVADENCCLASMLQGAMKNASAHTSRANIDFKYSNLENMPFPDNSMDIVYSFSKMHRWNNPVKVLKEIKRVCKKDGTIYICDTARDANEGMVSFILQYTGRGAKEFMEELRASYTTNEAEEILSKGGITGWNIRLDGINIVITNK